MTLKLFRVFAYRLTVWLAVFTMGAVPLMQPFAGVVDMPCTEVSSSVSTATEGLDGMHCPDHEQLQESQATNDCPINFHFCCAPVLGVVANTFVFEDQAIFFSFAEPTLPAIVQRAEPLFRPPRA